MDELSQVSRRSSIYSGDEVQSRFEPPSNWQELFDEDYYSNEQLKKKRLGANWNKPPTKIYDDNFGFGVNRYQCMIDYIDKKDRGIATNFDDSKLPYLEDRCMNKYSAKKPVKYYDNSQLDAYIDKGERIIERIRQNDVATPGNNLNRTHTNWSMTKKYVQLVKDSNVSNYKKDHEELGEEGSGKLQSKAYGSVGRQFALDSMDPLNLTLMTAHNNLDHAIYMTSRQQRMSELDDQMGTVVNEISDGASELNRRARQELIGRKRSSMLTPYDSAQSIGELASITEEMSVANRLRRKLDYEAMEEGVDEVISKYDKSRNRIRNNLNALDDTIEDIEDSVSAMRRRHKIERGLDGDNIPVAVLSSMTKKKARQMLNLHVDDEDIDDPAYARLKMRRRHEYLDDPAVTPFRRPSSLPETVSDVQCRVMTRAKQMLPPTTAASNIKNRAKYINIYVPRHSTADPDCIVRPSRTECNIDYMAKTLAAKGRMQRKFTVDEEEDLPVSGLNTYAYNQYNRLGENCIAFKPAEVVHSNSRRVRSAICVARQRNAIGGR